MVSHMRRSKLISELWKGTARQSLGKSNVASKDLRFNSNSLTANIYAQG